MPLNVQCKRCANLKNDWCESVIDSPDPDSNRDCQHFRIKTHYDEVHAMTAKELAVFIRDQIIDRNIGISSETWLDWLKSEVEP